MSSESDRQRLVCYARDAAVILEHSLGLCKAGQPYFYRVVAVQLRLLLCDTTRQHGRMIPTALAPRLWPDLRLTSLNEDPTRRNYLPLDAWLEQKLPQVGLTVRQFIRYVCDRDGGAHVDLRSHVRLIYVLPSEEWICRLGEIVMIGLAEEVAKEQAEP